MFTFLLAYLITLLGLAMIVGGIWGIFYLFRQTIRVPLRYYGMAIAMMCGGFGMVGVGQALRILLGLVAGMSAILTKVS
jgi:hypothetical protein